ncbi:hypothetical protein [[Mycoplasma] gypis]|uniref:Uncharacterized protein n=1 Tax=[Mycoplasma] gypis TaxID=92404 RepID=A0ABZ2RSI7_9BACT|nr:hypothetical protein [[Mycoplasma] gypis]MBN0919440.1 hypothetical protein [[Mycoplasma] gypis]
MILFITMLILQCIQASDQSIAHLIPNIEERIDFDAFKQVLNLNQFEALGRGGTFVFKIAIAVEAFLELWVLIFKILPRYIAIAWKNKKTKTINEVETLKAIKTKIENNIKLTRKEQNFYEKRIKQNKQKTK